MLRFDLCHHTAIFIIFSGRTIMVELVGQSDTSGKRKFRNLRWLRCNGFVKRSFLIIFKRNADISAEGVKIFECHIIDVAVKLIVDIIPIDTETKDEPVI